MTELIISADADQASQPRDFRNAVLQCEEKLIRQALTEAANKPTVAARLLGLTNHQALLAMLDNRHRKLRDELGITKRPRRKPIIKQ
jgi:transcriptional regulator with GAF, ATPase, and Fis domain